MMLTGLLVSQVVVSQSAAPPASRPNIVFIMADDLGYFDLGCYGNPYNRTPHIDSLARRGLRFTQAYSASPVCSPSRAAILTGKHPARLHLTNFLVGDKVDSASTLLPALWTPYLRPAEVTLAERLKQQGYRTGMVGKWHLGTADSLTPTAQGFDYERQVGDNGLDYYNYSITSAAKTVFRDTGANYLTDQLTDFALAFLEENRPPATGQARPFFLYLTYTAPHILLVPRADKLRHYLYKYERFGGRYNPYYGAMIESLDDGVGRVLRRLRELGLDRNTLIVFKSDNGGLDQVEAGPVPTSNAPLRSQKGFVYEGGIRVPLIIAGPGVAGAGTSCDRLVTDTDFVPTLLEWTGSAEQTTPGDGRSFAALLRTPGVPFDRGPLFWHYPHFSNQHSRPAGAVRVGNYKLIEHFETGKIELYDLATDPAEAHDLAVRQPQKANELLTTLRQWRTTVNANMPRPNPAFKAKATK